MQIRGWVADLGYKCVAVSGNDIIVRSTGCEAWLAVAFSSYGFRQWVIDMLSPKSRSQGV